MLIPFFIFAIIFDSTLSEAWSEHCSLKLFCLFGKNLF